MFQMHVPFFFFFCAIFTSCQVIKSNIVVLLNNMTLKASQTDEANVMVWVAYKQLECILVPAPAEVFFHSCFP